MKLNLSPGVALLLARLFLFVAVPVLLGVLVWALAGLLRRVTSGVKDAEPENRDRRRRRQLAEEAHIAILSSVSLPSDCGEAGKLRVRIRNDAGETAGDVRIWAYCRAGDKVVFAGVSPGEDLAPGIETLREIPLNPDVRCDEIKLKVSLGRDPRTWGPWL